MIIYVISSKRSIDFGLDARTASSVVLVSPDSLSRHNPCPEDISYLDAGDYPGPDIKKAAALLKRRSNGAPWGILDIKGAVDDPAAWFFEGASDYIGPKLFKAGIDKKRFRNITAFAGGQDRAPGGEASRDVGIPKNTAAKIIPSKFTRWEDIRANEVVPFFFLFVSLSSQTNLRSRIGEHAYNLLRTRLRSYLQQTFKKAEALLWMETETNSLFLIPSRSVYAKNAVTASLKSLLGSPLVTFESLGLTNIPVSFTFALHYGKTPFRAPGKTGTVVSDAVNFIFHLGTKHAERDRLTVSEDVPMEAIPEQLRDMFITAGTFEGRAIIRSRRFIQGGK
ncbi:hypothetical protein [Breznakiella homolactica]|uniref:Uncharacterized protein n=1 Tax=Breznakiella homolactica TaxID=2798577 RepID=A0A7T7XP15_9SPIR|nr:hypothetical protein [Breznakiella homolactica]QQO09856.1 hypothetical protein JFL75_02805 [Breznakiella homolactica]